MSIKKLAVLSASVLILASSTMVSSATSVDSGSTGSKFSLGIKLGGVLSKGKSDLNFSKYAITSILGQMGRYDDTADHFKPISAMSDAEIDECQGDGTTDATTSTHSTVDVAPNVVKIISSRYKAAGDSNPYSKIKAYSDELTDSVASSKALAINLQAALSIGVRFNNCVTFALNPLFEMPIKGRNATVSFSKESTSDSKDKNSNSSSSSSNSNSNSKSDTSLDVTVKSKPVFGVGGSLTVDINPCFSLGVGAGWKHLRYEIDVTNPNTNLLGITGTPKYDSAKKINATNTSGDALKNMRSTTVVNKINASMDVVYVDLTATYNINKYFGVYANLGVQSGGRATMKNEKEKIPNPDYDYKSGTSYYAGVGLNVKLM